jgi:hypothetical protein
MDAGRGDRRRTSAANTKYTAGDADREQGEKTGSRQQAISNRKGGSDFAVFEEEDFEGGEGHSVFSGGASFGAGEGGLHGLRGIEVQSGHQVISGRAERSCNGTVADFILAQAGDFLRKRDVDCGVVPVEGSGIFRGFLEHDHLGHDVSPV